MFRLNSMAMLVASVKLELMMGKGELLRIFRGRTAYGAMDKRWDEVKIEDGSCLISLMWLHTPSSTRESSSWELSETLDSRFTTRWGNSRLLQLRTLSRFKVESDGGCRLTGPHLRT